VLLHLIITNYCSVALPVYKESICTGIFIPGFGFSFSTYDAQIFPLPWTQVLMKGLYPKTLRYSNPKEPRPGQSPLLILSIKFSVDLRILFHFKMTAPTLSQRNLGERLRPRNSNSKATRSNSPLGVVTIITPKSLGLNGWLNDVIITSTFAENTRTLHTICQHYMADTVSTNFKTQFWNLMSTDTQHFLV